MTSTPLGNEGGFDPLQALLAESMEQVKEKAAESLEQKAAQAARARLIRGAGSAAERAEDAARILEWEAKREWSQEANVALFHTFTCACGGEENVFEGLFVRETHQVLRDSQRWRRIEAADATLPNELAYRDFKKPMCLLCMEEKGWAGEFYNLEGGA